MPLQSLSRLNSDFVFARATRLTGRLQTDSTSDSVRIQRLFLLATGHAPTDDDISAATRFLQTQTHEYLGQPNPAARAWTDLIQMLLIGNAALYVD